MLLLLQLAKTAELAAALGRARIIRDATKQLLRLPKDPTQPCIPHVLLPAHCMLLHAADVHVGHGVSHVFHAGFSYAFMSGFCTGGARLGAPDTGLISYAEMVDVVSEALGRAESLLCPREWLRAWQSGFACRVMAEQRGWLRWYGMGGSTGQGTGHMALV